MAESPDPPHTPLRLNSHLNECLPSTSNTQEPPTCPPTSSFLNPDDPPDTTDPAPEFTDDDYNLLDTFSTPPAAPAPPETIEDAMLQPASLRFKHRHMDLVYWHHKTRHFLYPLDRATWVVAALFVGFVIAELGPDPAFCVCGVQMAGQLAAMLWWPRGYTRYRDWICGSIRLWRVYMVYRLTSQGYIFSAVSHAVRLETLLLRQLLVASGALINFVCAIGYQLRFTIHLKMQLAATLAAVFGGATNVTAMLERDPTTSALVARLHSQLAQLSNLLTEGITTSRAVVASGQASVGAAAPMLCSPSPALVLVLTFQVYLGFILPTYILYVLEHSSKRRFAAEYLGYSPIDLTAAEDFEDAEHTPPKHPLILGHATSALIHSATLVVLWAATWELTSCAACFPAVSSLLARSAHS